MSAPTVVLVHGAFADSSSWNGVVERLQAKGVPVKAAANPLRGIAIDSAYIAGVLEQTPAPVVAVGHSYGGAVITNAAGQAENVAGLVYVAAFAPDEGERLGEAEGGSKDSVLNSALVPLHYANGGEQAVEFAIDPAKFRGAFAADLPEEETAVMAATQRPVAEPAFSEPTGAPAWKSCLLGRRRNGRQGGLHRRHPLDGGTGGRDDYRGRRLARGHGLAGWGRDGRDPGRARRDLRGHHLVGVAARDVPRRMNVAAA
jgi:pimeloyl-ACP methyl ester carboxylesterase